METVGLGPLAPVGTTLLPARPAGSAKIDGSTALSAMETCARGTFERTALRALKARAAVQRWIIVSGRKRINARRRRLS